MKSMDVLREKMALHPRREIEGRSYAGTPCLELLTLDGTRPVWRDEDGYTQVGDGQGGNVRAHRAALAIATGRDVWTEPLVTDHLCHTRKCVNPAHLEWTTNAVNVSAERTSHEGTEARRASARAGGRAAAESGRCAAMSSARRVGVVSRNLSTGELRCHRDQLTASHELGVRQGNISHVLSGRYRHTGTYTFERFDPTNPTHEALKERATP